MQTIFYNDNYIAKEEFKIGINDRAFNYGDGLFETIKILNGIPLFFKLHYSRMILALNELNYSIPEEWSFHYFDRIIHSLILKNNVQNVILKIHFSRKEGGKYAPENDLANCLMYFTQEDYSKYQLYNSPCKIDVFEKYFKSMQTHSFFKSINAQIYVQAALWAKQNKLDNAIVLNEQNRIADASNANIFLRINNFWMTPSVQEGGVDGILSRVLKKLMKQKDIELIEAPVSLQDLKSAKEVFLTNVVSGIISVSDFQHIKFQKLETEKIMRLLKEKVSAVIGESASS